MVPKRKQTLSTTGACAPARDHVQDVAAFLAGANLQAMEQQTTAWALRASCGPLKKPSRCVVALAVSQHFQSTVTAGRKARLDEARWSNPTGFEASRPRLAR